MHLQLIVVPLSRGLCSEQGVRKQLNCRHPDNLIIIQGERENVRVFETTNIPSTFQPTAWDSKGIKKELKVLLTRTGGDPSKYEYNHGKGNDNIDDFPHSARRVLLNVE